MLEEEGKDENPVKFRQLDDESDHDEEMREQEDTKMGIAMVRGQGGKQYWDDLSGKPSSLS